MCRGTVNSTTVQHSTVHYSKKISATGQMPSPRRLRPRKKGTVNILWHFPVLIQLTPPLCLIWPYLTFDMFVGLSFVPLQCLMSQWLGKTSVWWNCRNKIFKKILFFDTLEKQTLAGKLTITILTILKMRIRENTLHYSTVEYSIVVWWGSSFPMQCTVHLVMWTGLADVTTIHHSSVHYRWLCAEKPKCV